MKKLVLPLAVFAVMATTFSCKSKTDTATTTAETAEPTDPANAEAKPESNAAETKTFTVTATPDSALLGKNKEAFVKLKNWKAIQLSDPDGKSKGIQLSYEIEVTNNNDLKGNSVFINPQDFRLVLDNGTKITHDNYNSFSTEAQATNSSVDNKFILPPGTKPVALNMYLDETTAQVKLELK